MKAMRSQNLSVMDLESLTRELTEISQSYRSTFGWQSRLELLERAKKLLITMQITEDEPSAL